MAGQFAILLIIVVLPEASSCGLVIHVVARAGNWFNAASRWIHHTVEAALCARVAGFFAQAPLSQGTRLTCCRDSAA